MWRGTIDRSVLFLHTAQPDYYARLKAGGKVFWKSLETTVFSVAKQRLPGTVRDHRAKAESSKAFTNGKMTVGDATAMYLDKVNASISLKPRSGIGFAPSRKNKNSLGHMDYLKRSLHERSIT